MGWRGKLRKKAEARRKEDDGHPDDPTGPQTLDMAIVTKPVEFCQMYLKFIPTPYQEKLLTDESKRIYVCWSRQSGKINHACSPHDSTLPPIPRDPPVDRGARASAKHDHDGQDSGLHLQHPQARAPRGTRQGSAHHHPFQERLPNRGTAEQPRTSQGLSVPRRYYAMRQPSSVTTS